MSIKTDAIVIRDETLAGANTATRVGTNLVAIADDLVAKQVEIDANIADITTLQGEQITQDAAIGLNTTHRSLTTNPHSVTKTQVGLSNVDNTSDANKPVSTATQTALNLKADLVSPTFTGTVSGIDKTMVGLTNVDNTTDLLKPISTATQSALDGKQATLVSGTNIKTINSTSILGAGDIVISGGGGLAATDIDTLAELNAIVTDATLLDEGDIQQWDALTHLKPQRWVGTQAQYDIDFPTGHGSREVVILDAAAPELTAADITDFDVEVANNTAVALNTAKIVDTDKHITLPSNFNFASIPVGYDNKVWVIKYDFNLATASVTLPLNVTLSFEGGSITNGSIALNNTTIQYTNITSIIANVVLTGTLTNDALDVRLFGILPNNAAIDATVIINTNLITLDLELLFPKGNFYFTELHITKDNFKLRGVTGAEIATRTTFNPFVAAGQYYIIKLGGGKFTLNDASTHIQYPIIQDIHFTTPIGYTASNLTSVTDITGITYVNAALVIDRVAVGKFAINGNTLHNTPLVTIGASYELNFDYINMYGNHGLSDLPIIQIANNATAGQYFNATIIDKIQCEVFVGPVIKTSEGVGINELTIGDVTLEGTIEWEAENISSETRFTDLTKSLPAYYSTVNRVPLFDLGGTISMVINTMHINATSTEWAYDVAPLVLYTRTFANLNLLTSEIQINNILDGSYSQDFYIEGTASEVYRNTITIGQVNDDTAFYDASTGSLNLVTSTHDKDIIRLADNKEYFNEGLNDVWYPFFLGGIGLNNNLTTIDENSFKNVMYSRWDNPIFSQKGFYVDSDIIVLKGKIATTSTAIDIEYYDSGDVLLSTQSESTSVTPNVLFTNTLTLTKPVNYSYLKLINKSTGFLLKTYSIKTQSTVIGGGNLSTTDIDTLAELNAIVTDATLIDTTDARLSDARTPLAHTHVAADITDFDTEVANNTAVAANTAKTTNATHTGDVTGATALTIASTAISGKGANAGLVGTEEVLINNAGTLEKTTTQSIADLGGGGTVTVQSVTYQWINPDLTSGSITQQLVAAPGVGNAIAPISITVLAQGMTSTTDGTNFSVRFSGDGGELISGQAFYTGTGINRTTMDSVEASISRNIDTENTAINIVLTKTTGEVTTGKLIVCFTYATYSV